MKKRNKKLLVVIGIILLILIGIGGYFIIKSNTKEEVLLIIENKEYEINTEVKNTELISKEGNEKLTVKNKEENLDTSKLGVNQYTFTYETSRGKEKEIIVKYNVVDTTKPEITSEEKYEITEGQEIDLISKAQVKDNSNEELEITVEGEYDINKVGEYTLKYVVEDSSKNKAEKEFTLKVNKKPEQVNNNKTQSNNNSSNNNASNNNSNNKTNSGVDSSGFDPSELLEDCTKCFANPLPTYSITDEYNGHYNTAIHVRRTDFYWYVSYVEETNGVVTDVQWGISCSSGLSQPASENAKKYMPTPPTGQQAIDMYNANPNVTYGHTTLYVVIS